VQVLNSARSKIDAYAAQIGDFGVLVRRAQKYLLARGMIPLSGDARTRSNIQDQPMPVPKGQQRSMLFLLSSGVVTDSCVRSSVKTRTIGDMFMRRKQKDKKKRTLLPKLETLLEVRKCAV